MLSHAPQGAEGRAGLLVRANGVVLALLVQTAFIALLLISSKRPALIPRASHETILLLQALPKPAPRATTIDARRPSTSPQTIAPEVEVPTAPSPITTAPPPGIAGFGKSLFGCTPQAYGNLSPEERARCPQAGSDLASRQPPDLLNFPKSHVKDEVLWLEEQAEKNWAPECAGAVEVAKCMMHQSIAENQRARDARQKIADDKAAKLQEPRRPLPNIGVQRN
jgi:hypothetical protein